MVSETRQTAMTDELSLANQLLLACLLVSAAFHVVLLLVPVAHTREIGVGAGSTHRAHTATGSSGPIEHDAPLHVTFRKPREDISVPVEPPVLLPRQTPGPNAGSAQASEAKSHGRAAPVSAPLPVYHSAKELTAQPEPLSEIDQVLGDASRNMEEGQLVLRLHINEQGTVDELRVLFSSVSRDSEALVVQAFFQAKYRPGEIDGTGVKSEMIVSVDLAPTLQPETVKGKSLTR